MSGVPHELLLHRNRGSQRVEPRPARVPPFIRTALRKAARYNTTSIMKNARRSRVFVAVCWIYMSVVGAAFLFGLFAKDDFGVSFLPAMLLTLPWPYVLLRITQPLGLIPLLTAYYDLPLFVISALLNVGIAETVRRVRARASEQFIHIAPR